MTVEKIKKQKAQKNLSEKENLNLKNTKNCLEATQPENKLNHIEKNKIDTDSFFYYKRKHKEFIRNNKLILKTQQRFKSERHVFTEEINKIALRSNDNKMQ